MTVDLTRKIALRVAMLAVTAVSLYLLAPSLLVVFASWPKLRRVAPLWLGAAVLFECLSYVALWSLQRIALRTQSWFAVGTSQLASGAIGSIVPGGAATAGAFQYRLLVRAGVSPGAVAAGLTATLAATTAVVMALPTFALVAAVGSVAAPDGLRHAAYLGAGAFVLLLVIAVTAFGWDRPLVLVARAAQRAAGWLGRGDRFADLPARLLAQRDGLRRTFAERPVVALLSAIGKWGFDYAALLCILAGLGVRPDARLVLVAYATAMLLAMIPATPGGLGFVEAGLYGLLALAGVGAGVAAVATFAYRLVSFWLPLPAGLAAYLLARNRYGGVPIADVDAPGQIDLC
ncbi:MAG TPA: YbhN family protein [Gaiellaceae bacterium]|jgi:uncharacterized protein (TIRG00374 family)|nr:YbhN family protein [Gaiellaceae bacterium]